MTAPKLRDEIITNEVANKRVAAGISRQVERLIKVLRSELQLLVFQSRVLDTKTPASRQKKYRKLDLESKRLIREAYSRIHSLTRREFIRFSVAESDQTEIAFEDNA